MCRRLLAKYTMPWMVVSWKNVSKPLCIFCHNSNFPTPDDRTDLGMFSLRLCTASLKITVLFQSTSVFLIFMSFSFSLYNFSLPLVSVKYSTLVIWFCVNNSSPGSSTGFWWCTFFFISSLFVLGLTHSVLDGLFFVIRSVTIKVFFSPTLLCSQNRLNLLGFVCLFACLLDFNRLCAFQVREFYGFSLSFEWRWTERTKSEKKKKWE